MSSQSVFPSDVVSLVESHLREVPDFPAPGVLFRGITPLVADSQTFKVFIETIAERYRGQVNTVAGPGSKGFIFDAPLAIEMGVGVLIVREEGRLPGPIVGVDYDLEYDSTRVELQPSTVTDGQRVLVIDDILATGGTANAASELIERAGDVPTRLYMLIKLRELGGRGRPAGREVDVALTYWSTVTAYSRHHLISAL